MRLMPLLNKSQHGKSASNLNSHPKLIQIIDPKKAQNLAILLKALNVMTEKVCNALKEGSLHKAENSRLFMKLLEAVLKMGNRMNDGTYHGGAQAFKLDTLLKLSDVKGTDGKTTLLSFVVQEIIRSEGIEAALTTRPRGSSSSVNTEDLQEEPTEESPEYYQKLGLEVVSQLSKELQDVKRAAVVDGDNITSTVSKLGNMLKKTKDLTNNELNTAEEATEFCTALNSFMEHAEDEMTWMLEEDNGSGQEHRGLFPWELREGRRATLVCHSS